MRVRRIREKHWIDKDWGAWRLRRRGQMPDAPQLSDDPRFHRWMVQKGWRKRVTCILAGQLGNQLHEIATTISHASRVRGFAFLPDWAYWRVFRCRFPYGLSTEGMELFEESEQDYHPIPPRGEIVIRGYFQSCRFLDENLVRKAFRFHPKIQRYVRYRYRDVLRRQPTSIHVRRGDTLKPENHMKVLPSDYYDRAMELLSETEQFVIFSDDIPWCRERFRGPRFTFIEGEPNFVDLCTMSLCKNHIIPNSTFSWWGAWLNSDPDKKVVAPRIWYKPDSGIREVPDRIPANWTTLD